jgi:KUP system potassium uptake protein
MGLPLPANADHIFLVAIVAHGVWKLPASVVIVVAGLFLLLDATFVLANIHKIPGGGWFPLVVGAVSLTLMLSWRPGRAVALERREESAMPLEAFIQSLSGPDSPQRVPGTAIYLTARRDVLPAALALNLKHNGVLHELVVAMKVVTERSPRVPETGRMLVEKLPAGLRDVTLRFGFAEKPDVLAALKHHADAAGFDATTASFFLCAHELGPHARPSPANEAIVAGRVWAKVNGQVAPGCSRSQDPEDAFEDTPVVHP